MTPHVFHITAHQIARLKQLVKELQSEVRAECNSKTCKCLPQLMSFMTDPGMAGFASRCSKTVGSSHSIMSLLHHEPEGVCIKRR